MDSLILNLNADEEVNDKKIKISAITANLKKGSWQAKRKYAQRIVRRISQKDKKEEIQDIESNESNAPVDPIQAIESNPPIHVQKKVKTADPVKGVISSLFSGNPEDHSTLDLSTGPVVMSVATPLFTDTTFTGMGLNDVLCRHIQAKLGFDKPTPIQRKSIPSLMHSFDSDVIIQAETGSGKTLAFLLPIVHALMTASSSIGDGNKAFSRNSGTFAIILSPTRELARQTSAVLDSLLKCSIHNSEDGMYRHWMVSGALLGGEKKKSEKARLRKGVTLLVCTPGRLLDHLKTTHAFDTGNIRWMILDEADNLLHLGFEETLREILLLLKQRRATAASLRLRMDAAGLPGNMQTILCSATIESGVKQLAENVLVNPQFIFAGDTVAKQDAGEEHSKETDVSEIVEQIAKFPKQLKQTYVIAPAKLRLVSLIALLRQSLLSSTSCKIIVFVATGDSVDWHYDAFGNAFVDENEGDSKPDEKQQEIESLKKGLPVAPLLPNTHVFKLHGSMPHNHRLAAFSGFCADNESGASILICTDVAARGLDIQNISHIIQYDPPSDVRDYIHRIGRTARLGRQGTAALFLMPSEIGYLEVLQKLGCSLTRTPEVLEQLSQFHFGPSISTAKSAKAAQKGRKAFEVIATDLHMAFERYTLSSPERVQLAQKAFSSQVRSYASHAASERYIFHVKNLHLGHIAKSFALREAPTGVVGRLGQYQKKKVTGDEPISASTMKRKANEMLRNALTSEFGDGNITAIHKGR